MASAIIPVHAAPFEDFIDGYFPLSMSLRHMLDRHGFTAAWIVMRVAPMMDIPGLAPDRPVPLHLDPAQGGQIDWLAASVRRDREEITLSGAARWHWNRPARETAPDLPSTLRLAEPAFLRGIGFPPGDLDTGTLGCLQRAGRDCHAALRLPGHSGNGSVTRYASSTAVCWRLSGAAGLTEWNCEHTRPWAEPYDPAAIPDSPEPLLLLRSGTSVISRIVSDSLAY